MVISEDQLITVTILKYDKFNKRKDIKHPWWFAMSNKFLEDPEMDELNNAEAWAWVYIMSLSSKKQSRSVTIPWSNVKRQNRFKPRDLISAIQKLSAFQIVAVDVQDPYAIRTDSVRDPYATGQDITIHNNNNTEQDITPQGVCRPLAKDLLLTWNENCGELPKAEKLTKKREGLANARLGEQPDLAYWKALAERVAASDFCNNRAKNSNGWVANFDWFIRPDTQHAIREGRYDNRKGKAVQGKFQRTESADKEFQDIFDGVVNQ